MPLIEFKGFYFDCDDEQVVEGVALGTYYSFIDKRATFAMFDVKDEDTVLLPLENL
jgi:hypothetical protein